MSRRRWTDVAVGAWVVCWIWMGVAITRDIRDLRHLSETVASVGRAAQDTGRALRAISDLPLVGDEVRESANSIEQAGSQAVESGVRSRDSIGRTSVLLGISIILIPITPVLLLYAPGRRRPHRSGPSPT